IWAIENEYLELCGREFLQARRSSRARHAPDGQTSCPRIRCHQGLLAPRWSCPRPIRRQRDRGHCGRAHGPQGARHRNRSGLLRPHRQALAGLHGQASNPRPQRCRIRRPWEPNSGTERVTQMRRTSGARSQRKTANDGGHGLTDQRSSTTGSAGGPVGYARPPLASRFKPGKSGNPHGRPRNSRNLKTIIQSALTAPVVVREGARKRSISKLEGIVLKQVESALKGNEKAALTTLK